METLVKKSLIVGVIGIAILIALSYAILMFSDSGTTYQPGDVVAGWAVMFFFTIGIICSVLLIGILAAWWTYADSRSTNDTTKASLIAGVTTITILAAAAFALILLIGNNATLFQLFIIGFSIFYIITAIFSVMGGIFYLFVFRNLIDYVKHKQAMLLWSIVAGVLPGCIAAFIIAITWDHLNDFPLSDLLIDLLVFSLMACSSGILSSILPIGSNRTDNIIPKNMIAGSVVAILALMAPIIVSVEKAAALPGTSVILLIMMAPLAIISGMTIAIVGSALVCKIGHILKAPINTDARNDVPFYWNSIKIGTIAGVLLALFMFLPIPIAAISGDAKIDIYYRISSLMTIVPFILVPIVEAYIGYISAKYFSIKTTREATVASGIASSTSVLFLLVGDMANNILQIYFVPYFTPGSDLLSLNAYMFMTRVIMCYPFVIVALIAIAMASGSVMAESRFKKDGV